MEALDFPAKELIFSDPEVTESIQRFRTDINKLTHREMNILENTGYFLAAARFHKASKSLARLLGEEPDRYDVRFDWPVGINIDSSNVTQSMEDVKNQLRYPSMQTVRRLFFLIYGEILAQCGQGECSGTIYDHQEINGASREKKRKKLQETAAGINTCER
jgi:hypothetical protein